MRRGVASLTRSTRAPSGHRELDAHCRSLCPPNTWPPLKACLSRHTKTKQGCSQRTETPSSRPIHQRVTCFGPGTLVRPSNPRLQSTVASSQTTRLRLGSCAAVRDFLRRPSRAIYFASEMATTYLGRYLPNVLDRKT